MSACCDHDCGTPPASDDRVYRRILWVALTVNALMFAVEIVAGVAAGSSASSSAERAEWRSVVNLFI